MKISVRASLFLLSSLFVLALPAAQAKSEMLLTETALTRAAPYVLPDKTTKITVTNQRQYKNRKQFVIPTLLHKSKDFDIILDIAPNTVIASGGQFYHLAMPYDYKWGEIREEDTIQLVLDSCKFMVRRERMKAPVIELKPLKGTLAFSCSHNNQTNEIKSLRGKGKHFTCVRVRNAEIYRRGNAKVLGTGMDIVVVTNFGSKNLRLEYMQPKTITVGPETITLESLDFVYKAKTVNIKVSTKPKVEKATAFIVEYSEVKKK